MKSCPTIPVPQAKSINVNLICYITEMKPNCEEWWRWRPPLMLISLKNFITQLFLPPNLPPNVRLRQLNLYKGLYRISMNISEFD